jgi:DtxR family Mn-dependent transcriptional regulator
MARKLGYPVVDPHGDPIPDRHGQLTLAAASRPLSELEPGCAARLARVHAQDGEHLRYLGELGLYPGAQVAVLERAPFQGPLLVTVNGAPHMLAFDLAAELSVEVIYA